MFTFRPLTREDFRLVARWLAEPGTAYWWDHEWTDEALETDFGAVIDREEPAEDWIALLDGEPFGIVQYCRFADYPEYVGEMEPVYPVGVGAASIDYLVGAAERRGQGLGTEMLRDAAAFVWDHDPEATHLVVPVNTANQASWRALRSAGFRLVAHGELEPDNPGHERAHVVLRLDRPDRPMT